MVEENPLTTAVDIHKDTEINHNKVAESTIRQYLSDQGYHARKIPVRLSISEQNKSKRLQFC